MPSSDETQIIREAQSALALARDLDAAIPEPVKAARDVHAAARRATVPVPDRATIGALALDESPKKAAKMLAEGRDAQEVYVAAREAAARRLLQAIAANADEIVQSALSAAALRAAVDEIAEVAPGVPASVPFFPAAGSPEGDVIGAGRLRQAEDTLKRVAARLSSNPTLGVSFPEDRVPLVWIDPSDVEGVKDFTALERALMGMRPGAIPFPVTVPGPSGAPMVDPTPRGIPSAIAAAVPGVRFSLVTSPEEFDARTRKVTEGLRRKTTTQGTAAPSGQGVVLN